MDINLFYSMVYKTVKNTEKDFIPPKGTIYTDSDNFKDISFIKMSFSDKNDVNIEGWLYSLSIGDYIKLINSTTFVDWGIYEIISYRENIINNFIEMSVFPVFIKGEKYDRFNDNIIILSCSLEENNSDYLIKHYSEIIIEYLKEISSKTEGKEISSNSSSSKILISSSSKISKSSSSIHGSKVPIQSSSSAPYIPPPTPSGTSSSTYVPKETILSVDSFVIN